MVSCRRFHDRTIAQAHLIVTSWLLGVTCATIMLAVGVIARVRSTSVRSLQMQERLDALKLECRDLESQLAQKEHIASPGEGPVRPR